MAKELVSATVLQSLEAVGPLQRGRTEARETNPVQPVSEALVDQTLDHLTPTVHDMVQVQRHSGMRPSEVCLLRKCDIEKTEGSWIYRPHEHKTEHRGRERLVFLGPQCQAILQGRFNGNPWAYVFDPRQSERERLEARRGARKTPTSCGNRPGMNRTRKPRRTPGPRYDRNSYA